MCVFLYRKPVTKFLLFFYFCCNFFIIRSKFDNIFLSCFNINLLEILSFFWVFSLYASKWNVAYLCTFEYLFIRVRKGQIYYLKLYFFFYVCWLFFCFCFFFSFLRIISFNIHLGRQRPSKKNWRRSSILKIYL